MKDLEEQIKIKMGFIDKAPTCNDCAYKEDITDQSGGWYSVCTYARVQSFRINDYSGCNEHTYKKQKDDKSN